ncbi:MAG: inorganic phosphate transporter [Candidatus Nezhaarchaeales archaeon]
MLPPLFIAGLALSLIFAWGLGANDAANSMGTSVGSRVLTLRRALILFTVFMTAGAMLQGYMVIKTIGRGLLPPEAITDLGAVSIVLGGSLWIILCTWRGIPISTTHSVIGAALGYGLLRVGLSDINWLIVGNVVLSWLISPALSMVIAFITYKALMVLIGRITANGGSIEPLLRLIQVGTACYVAYAFGANDVGNATGVFLVLTERYIGGSASQLLAAWGVLGVALGAWTWGYRVIYTIGSRITRLSVTTGFTAEFSAATTILAFTIIPYALFGFGMPISTTHCAVGAVIGVGIARGGTSGVDRVVTIWIVLAWLATVLSAALLTIIAYKLLSFIAWLYALT